MSTHIQLTDPLQHTLGGLEITVYPCNYILREWHCLSDMYSLFLQTTISWIHFLDGITAVSKIDDS